MLRKKPYEIERVLDEKLSRCEPKNIRNIWLSGRETWM
jgi:hypothetical protein